MQYDRLHLFSRNDLQLGHALLRASGERLAAWRRRRLGLRGVLVHVLSLPLLLAAPGALASGNFVAALASASAFGLCFLGARLNRRALMERLIAPERRYTRASPFPRHYLAALLVSAGTGLVAHSAVGHQGLVSLGFAVLAAVGFHLAYRLPAPSELVSAARVAVANQPLRRALEQAEGQLLSIEKAALQIGNRELEQRLHEIAVQGKEIIRMLEQRPADLFRIRRFLVVHLEGAERVAVSYARSHRIARGGALEQNFRKVLAQIESAFRRQREQLLNQDLSELDVQIEVLRRQLQSEGIA